MRTEVTPRGNVRTLSAAEEAEADARDTAEREAVGDRKRAEAVAYMNRVLMSSCPSPFGANRYARLDSANRLYLQSISMRIASLLDQGTNTATIFPQRIEVVNITTGKSASVSCTKTDWHNLTEDIFQFHDAAKASLEAIIARINALGSDHAAIDAIDVARYPGTVSAAWPAFYED